jgi:hypothetical protein
MTVSGWMAGTIAALTLTAAARGATPVHGHPEVDFPPNAPAADETPTTDLAPFETCESGLAMLRDKMGGELIGRHYTTSPKWGHVMRAKLLMSPTDAAQPMAICWVKDGTTALFIANPGFEH